MIVELFQLAEAAGKPIELTLLTEKQKKSNRKKSRIRARVEPIFGFMTNTMKDGSKMRWIGMRRIALGIELLNLVYNMARHDMLLQIAFPESTI